MTTSIIAPSSSTPIAPAVADPHAATRLGVQGAVVIESRRHTAGLALPDGNVGAGGVQFFASHPLFQALDGQRFRSLRALERAVVSLEAALADQRRTRDSRGQVWRSWQTPGLDGDLDGDDESAAA